MLSDLLELLEDQGVKKALPKVVTGQLREARDDLSDLNFLRSF